MNSLIWLENDFKIYFKLNREPMQFPYCSKFYYEIMKSLLLRLRGWRVQWSFGSLSAWLKRNQFFVSSIKQAVVLYSAFLYVLRLSFQAKQESSTLLECHFFLNCHVGCFNLRVSGLNQFLLFYILNFKGCNRIQNAFKCPWCYLQVGQIGRSQHYQRSLKKY